MLSKPKALPGQSPPKPHDKPNIIEPIIKRKSILAFCGRLKDLLKIGCFFLRITKLNDSRFKKIAVPSRTIREGSQFSTRDKNPQILDLLNIPPKPSPRQKIIEVKSPTKTSLFFLAKFEKIKRTMIIIKLRAKTKQAIIQQSKYQVISTQLSSKKGTQYLNVNIKKPETIKSKIEHQLLFEKRGRPHTPCPLVQPLAILVPIPAKNPAIINPAQLRLATIKSRESNIANEELKMGQNLNIKNKTEAVAKKPKRNVAFQQNCSIYRLNTENKMPEIPVTLPFIIRLKVVARLIKIPPIRANNKSTPQTID
ncbi:hypothetical protein TTHERM_01137220 (macronuclear) [Tetrahymena thermophila SB210]|uniref:Uncharacterized protein n=1 Tax=Tetrahymena thermophila (strain SB210) TaxID=312017 RepID=Q235R5_TETTS|nr:hypothetical protein TTHERM_01137220 [Tetrahymena thermophila SB210]EAR92291.1 hypothetical protein TTHERM_01137220 [Tetrahymena thermophila SB210]|eukprot:XP_001012536.1 hypothetical protein TTHERM_01137220 [Tetrahymena thermophila SB210]